MYEFLLRLGERLTFHSVICSDNKYYEITNMYHLTEYTLIPIIPNEITQEHENINVSPFGTQHLLMN